MARRLNHESVNRATKIAASHSFTSMTVPTAKRTGITCGCGLDLAHFGSRPRFVAHRDQCSPLASA